MRFLGRSPLIIEHVGVHLDVNRRRTHGRRRRMILIVINGVIGPSEGSPVGRNRRHGQRRRRRRRQTRIAAVFRRTRRHETRSVIFLFVMMTVVMMEVQLMRPRGRRCGQPRRGHRRVTLGRPQRGSGDFVTETPFEHRVRLNGFQRRRNEDHRLLVVVLVGRRRRLRRFPHNFRFFLAYEQRISGQSVQRMQFGHHFLPFVPRQRLHQVLHRRVQRLEFLNSGRNMLLLLFRFRTRGGNSFPRHCGRRRGGSQSQIGWFIFVSGQTSELTLIVVSFEEFRETLLHELVHRTLFPVDVVLPIELGHGRPFDRHRRRWFLIRRIKTHFVF